MAFAFEKLIIYQIAPNFLNRACYRPRFRTANRRDRAGSFPDVTLLDRTRRFSAIARGVPFTAKPSGRQRFRSKM
jgi:hypothetical protein